MASKRTVLNALTRETLLEVASWWELAGLTGKSKDEIVDAIVKTRSISLEEVLEELYRDDLKRICRALDLDDSGREKARIVNRILGREEDDEDDGGQTPPVSSAGKRAPKKRPIEPYEHTDKQRLNNPPAGLVTPESDPDAGNKTYQYDPHLDPQLVWAGKAEHTSFEVPTVSLHVHERIEPRTIIESVRKRNGDGNGPPPAGEQLSFFEAPNERPPLREAVDFYKHPHGWSNRLVAGDSLLVMNSLLEKEGLGGQVQMIYIDPPYGIRYGSNFQPFVNRRDVKDGKDEDLTQEPEMIKAFRDTWELGIHSYLTYLRDRLLLARELLSETGSCFVQISDENVHRVRAILDDVFGSANFVAEIAAKKTGGFSSRLIPTVFDTIIWYARDANMAKYRQLYFEKQGGTEVGAAYSRVLNPDGSWRSASVDELAKGNPVHGGSFFAPTSLSSEGSTPTGGFEYEFEGRAYRPPPQSHWKTTKDGLDRLRFARRLVAAANSLRYVRYISDFPAIPITSIWDDLGAGSFTEERLYVVQTRTKIVARCLLMTTDPGDLVLDPTCGSGTTAYVAEQWGRRWITCDTSRVAIALAKQRLMTAVFDYYELAHPNEGIGSGFRYKTVPHVMLKSIANNPEIREGMTRKQIDAAIAKYADQETLYDQPQADRSKARVTGPFTVESVPAPHVQPLDDVQPEPQPADNSVARQGATLRHTEWQDELQKTGIRGKGGQRIEFARLEPLGGARWLHAEGETKGSDPKRVVVSFGPEHAPLEPRQVGAALEEAQTLVPKPQLLVFAAFQFDSEAAKDIDETNWPGVTLLKAQMNADLLTEDLKKKRASNDSFWLIGQPDVNLKRIGKGEDRGKYRISVEGFDYYNTRTGNIESGDTAKIAMWMLDTDYDGWSLYPRQVFFPMAGPKDGWARLTRNLKAEIDEERIEAFRGTESLPFEPGEYKRIAVMIIDDRGIESLKVIRLEEGG